MNKYWILFLVTVTLLCAGCATTYRAERTNPETGSHTKLDVKSYREFQGGVTIHYNRDTGTFDLSAGDVTTGTSPLEEAAAALLLQMPILLAPAQVAVDE